MIKTKEEISDLYKKTFKHSQFIEHSKIEDFIHQIREEDRKETIQEIKEMIEDYNKLLKNVLINEILQKLDNLNKA